MHVRQTPKGGGSQTCGQAAVEGGGTMGKGAREVVVVLVLMRAKIKYEKCYEFPYN